MFRALGFGTVFIPPLTVFLLVATEFAVGINVPVTIVALIYPLGILLLLVYFSIRPNSIRRDHFLDFSKGARLATLLTVFGSVSVGFFPIFAGEPFLGPALIFVSLGSIWMPGALAAGDYGVLLSNSEMQLSQAELKGTKHGGIALLFLAWLLKQKAFLSNRSKDASWVLVLAAFYVFGWVYLSLAGGFPYTILGATMVLLVPLGSRRVLMKTLNPDDVGRLLGILTS